MIREAVGRTDYSAAMGASKQGKQEVKVTVQKGTVRL